MAPPGYIGRYINLDRSPDRRRDIEALLNGLGLTERYERFSGVDGHAAPAHPGVRNPAELGCYLSHLGVIRDAVGTDRWLHVLEDDAEISRFAGRVIDAITTSPDVANYDIVFTNIGPPLNVSSLARWRALFDDNVRMTEAGEVSSVTKITLESLAAINFVLCTSYLVNPRSTAKIAGLLESNLNDERFTPVDIVFSNLSHSGQLSIACTMPFLTTPRLGVASAIGNQRSSGSNGHLIIERALYADREVAHMRQLAADLDSSPSSSITAELMMPGIRYLIGR
jgi:GR25 family glycosyltransferase involved in LPS biosynthesis